MSLSKLKPPGSSASRSGIPIISPPSGFGDSLFSRLFKNCLEALRQCETFYDSVFEQERIRLQAWGRDTGVQEGLLDKAITAEDEMRPALYILFGNISLVLCSALRPIWDGGMDDEYGFLQKIIQTEPRVTTNGQ